MRSDSPEDAHAKYARFLRRSSHDLARLHGLLEGDAAALDETAMRDVRNLAHRIAGAAEALDCTDVALAAENVRRLAARHCEPRYDFGLLTLQFGTLLVKLREALVRAGERRLGF